QWAAESSLGDRGRHFPHIGSAQSAPKGSTAQTPFLQISAGSPSLTLQIDAYIHDCPSEAHGVPMRGRAAGQPFGVGQVTHVHCCVNEPPPSGMHGPQPQTPWSYTHWLTASRGHAAPSGSVVKLGGHPTGLLAGLETQSAAGAVTYHAYAPLDVGW